MLISNTERALLRLNLQFFGAEGTGGGEGSNTGTGTDTATDNGGTDGKGKGENEQQDNEQMRKFIQSEVDRLMADERKKNSDLKKENDKLKKEKMTAEELKKYEDEQKAKDLADREKAIADRENRYYALNAIIKANIGVDSNVAEEVVELVIGSDSEEIDKKIATLSKIVNTLSANKVDTAFKANGRTPKGATSASGEGEKETNVAEMLGKQTAEANKKASDVLKHYINRR